MSETLDRPKYVEIRRRPNGARDKRGNELSCMNGDGRQAIWVGKRRPAARIMVRGFEMCDECWKKERMR